MIGTFVGLGVGMASSNTVGRVIGTVLRVDTLSKLERIGVMVGAGGIGMVVGNKVSAEVEKTINSFTGGENYLTEE